MNWINKQRSHTFYQYQDYQKKAFTYELYIFSDEEKRFLFTQFLCNPEELEAAQISVPLVKCFQKYFRMINIAENFLRGHKAKIKVLGFEKLIGMDAL